MPTCRIVSGLAFALLGVAPLADTIAADLLSERSLKIIQNTQANFPAALALQGVSEGEVRTVLHVDADGKLVDCLVTAYTHRELADEVLANVREWDYEPARQRGEPVGTRVEVVFAFEAHGSVLSLMPGDALLASASRLIRPAMTTLICRRAELDESLRAVHVVEPQHPGNRVPQPGSRPAAVIDFYIDTEGRPRMPVVVRASHELYAIAAIEALSRWRFAPPTRQGRPMIVRATQSFVFSERS